jgi:hypothetical protein
MVAKSASKGRSRDKTPDSVVAKSDPKDRFKVRTHDVDRSEVESLPSPPRRKSRGRGKPNPTPIEDEEHSASTSSALSESTTKVKVRLRRFFSRKSPKSPKQLPLPTTFDILEDLSFTEEIMSVSRSSSRLSRKSYVGSSHSSEDIEIVSGTRSKTIVGNSQSTSTDDFFDKILENREDVSMTSMESDGTLEMHEIAKALQHNPNSWSDQVKDAARRYYPSSPLSLAEAERRALLTPVQESAMSEDEKSETNSTSGLLLLTPTSNDQPGDNGKESSWKSEMTDYRDENCEESRTRDHANVRDDSLREHFPRSEHTYLPVQHLEDSLSRNEDLFESLSRNEDPGLQGALTIGSMATFHTTETTLLTVEQLKRDLELFSVDMLPNMQCQESGANPNHPNGHKTDHVLPGKPWCYAPEQGELFDEVKSEASTAPANDRMFGCMPIPELYTSSSPVTSPTHRSDLQFVQVGHEHHGMNIMSDITSFELSQASTDSGSFSEHQSSIGLDAAASGQTTFSEDSESLSVQTDDELSHTEDEFTQTDDDDFTQTEDDDFTQTDDDSDSSVSTASAPETGQFRSWRGSPTSSNSNSDSDSESDSSSTVHTPYPKQGH